MEQNRKELIEKGIIDCIKFAIEEEENGWWEVFRRSFNDFIPLDELIEAMKNSNEINECIEQTFDEEIENLNKFIEDTIEKNYKELEQIYNKRIEIEK